MRRITLLFAVLLSLVGGAKAQTTETFDSWGASLPDGWSLLGGATYGTSYGYTYIVDADYASSGKALYSNQSSATSTAYIVTPKLTGSVSLKFRKKGTSSSTKGYIYVYTYDEATEAVGTTSLFTVRPNGTNEATSKYQSGSFTVSSETRLAILIANAVIDDFTYTAVSGESTDGPVLVVKDGDTKLASPYAYNFGLTTAGTTKTFTLSNPGTEDLGVSVAETGNFDATLSATTIAAGGEVTLTVTMPEATGSSAVTITPASDDIDPFVINVSGTIKDPNKSFVDFADGQMPDGWSNVKIGSYGNGWEVNTGYASHSNSASSYYYAALTSPLLKFTEGETLCFDVARYGSSTYSTPMVKVQTSTDGTTWTDVYTTPNAELVYGQWKTQSVAMAAGNYYIRFYGGYAHITNIYGGELPLEPNLKFSASDYAFGVIAEATTSSTFTISNSGKATLTGVSVASNNSVFTVSDVPTSIAAGESATFTVTMSAATTGAQNGTITVSADGFDDVTFNVSGYVLDTDVIVVDFAGNTVPEGWANSGFEVSNNELSTTYNTRTLTSPAITVAEGQQLVIYAKGGSTWGASLTVKTSTNNGSTWTTAKSFTSELQQSTTDYVVLVVNNIAAGNYLLQLEGYYVTINTINGYTYNMEAPVLAFTAEDFAAGKVTESKSKTYTVSNSGTGTLTVNIASDDEHFTVSPTQLVITDEPQEFTVTFNYEEGVYGKFSGNITVTPTYDETAAVAFTASAQVVDPNLWEEDFEEGTLPTGWVANNWTIGTFSSYENTTKMALAPSGSSVGTLITPCLSAKEGDVLTWDAYLNWYDEALIVEYSADDQATWTQIYNYTTQGDADAPSTSTRNYHKEMSFTAPADGNYYLRFTSTFQNGVDNFNGFKLNLADHIMTITASNIPTSGSYSPSMKATQSFEATVTVKESRGVDEENVVAKLYMGEDVIGTSETTTVAAGESKVITITATPAVAATEGVQMHIEVEWAGETLTTEAETRYVAEFVKLELTENAETEIETGYSAVYDQVTLTRNFVAGWNTFVTPVAVNLSEFGEGAEAYSFTGYADGALTFSVVSSGSLNAATPYIIYVPEAINGKVFTWNSPVIYSSYVGTENIKTTHNDATFQGTYAPIAKGGMEGKYGVTSEAKIAKGTANASIKGFRAYFELPEGASVKALRFDGGETGVRTIRVDANGADTQLFDLSGRRVNGKAVNGTSVYIINGKKVSVK